MDALLQSMGFKDIVHFKSGNERYPICLSKATKEIMIRYLDEPFLLVEDDIGITNILEFTIPLDADAIYLGLSLCASHPTEIRNAYYSKFEKYTADQVKVINMLATHAVFYVSRKYKEAVIKAMDKSIEMDIVNDICISRIQKDYTIYANKIPSFYQSDEFNKDFKYKPTVEQSTKIQIMEDLTLVPLI